MINNKLFHITFFSAIFLILLSASNCFAKDFTETLSTMQRARMCAQIKDQAPIEDTNDDNGTPVVPSEVFQNMFNANKMINDRIATLLALGHSLMCHAVHAGSEPVEIPYVKIKLFDVPDVSVWLTGIIIYIVGFMMSLSLAFYLADIAFKLGFAVIMLPIGIALWPFPPTKDKLSILISIIAKSAAIFAFLAITVSYAIFLVDAAFETNMVIEFPFGIPASDSFKNKGGIEQVLELVDNNMSDQIAANFTIFSSFFLILIFALLYGFKLIGATIPDYVNKFFPDKAFGNASPIHGSMTQGLDFGTKTAGGAALKVGKKVGGKAMEGVGNVISGKSAPIGQQMGNFAKKTSSILTGTVGRVVMGKKASQSLQRKINSKIDEGAERIDNSIKDRKEKRQAKREARREKRREKFNNSAVGKAYNKVNNAYQNGIQKVANARKRIDAGFKKVTEPIKNFRNNSVRAIDKFVANQSQRRAKMRNKVNNWSKLYSKIDSGALKSNAGDSIFKRVGKSSLRGIIKAPIKVVDVAHRAVNGVAVVGLNTLTIAGGEVAKGLIKGSTKIVEAPIKVVSGVVQAPMALAEGTMRLANVKQNLNIAKNILKSAGEVMAETGREMQNTNETPLTAQRKREEQENYEKEKRKAGEW